MNYQKWTRENSIQSHYKGKGRKRKKQLTKNLQKNTATRPTERKPSISHEHILRCVCVCVCMSVWKFLGHVWFFATPWLQLPRFLCPWNSPGKKIRMSSHSHPQGIFLIQGSNWGLSNCRQILYNLSHLGSPYWSDHLWKTRQILIEIQEFKTRWWSISNTSAKLSMELQPGPALCLCVRENEYVPRD